ncbi:MAG: hypothetical protein K9N49_03830 [Candidatus Marinimicrobia bacterium]|nr:hypothetical protein [Candidatus Neomarinimicrobiota bacterium]
MGLLEIAQAFLRALAESHEIAPTLLATTSELEALVADRQRADPERHALLQGWRYAVAGARLLELLEGNLAVRVGPSGTLVFESAHP